jgi:hypothetical protein
MIITALNYAEPYYSQFKAFATSLATNSPSDRLRVYLVGFPREELDTLGAKFPSYELIDFPSDKPERATWANYMVSLRSRVVRMGLQELQAPVAWMDNDIIVRKDFSCFWDDIGPTTLKVLRRDSAVPRRVFQCGVFGLGYSTATLEYSKIYNKKVQTTMKWLNEQRQLYLCYKRMATKIQLNAMSKDFNDFGRSEGDCFYDRSRVWHCKSKHFKNPVFAAEFDKYAKLYREASCLT